MKALPNASQVREARRLANEADKAALLVGRCAAVVTSLNVLARQAEAGTIEGFEIPGQEIIDDAIETFPTLANLRDIDPDTREDLQVGLRKRRQQLASLEQLLAPVVAQQIARAREIHHLQHEQAQLLQQPEWDELRADLAERHALHQAAMGRIPPLQLRRNTALPAARATEQLLPQVAEELADPAHQHIGRHRLVSLLQGLESICSGSGLQVDVPSPEWAANDGPDAVLERLRTFHVALTEELAAIEAELEASSELAQGHMDWILARTG